MARYDSVKRQVRSSGRDYRAVRRLPPALARASVEELLKADVVALAEERGVDATGTKAEVVERLTAPESNDATVETPDA